MHQAYEILTSILMSPCMKAILATRVLKLRPPSDFYQITAHLFLSSFFRKRTVHCWGSTPLSHITDSIIPNTTPLYSHLLCHIWSSSCIYSLLSTASLSPWSSSCLHYLFFTATLHLSSNSIPCWTTIYYLLSISLCLPTHRKIVCFLLLLSPSSGITWRRTDF